MALRRVWVDGKVLNTRTADMLALWQFNCLTNFYVLQGSYNKGGVTQSAGTHDGGGAVDISVYGWSDEFTRHVVLEGRKVGFAVWYRPTIRNLWTEHLHGIAIGDPELSSGARGQVSEYYAGGDGLVGGSRDTGPRLSPIPVWPTAPSKSVPLLVAYVQFKTKNPKPKTAVKRIQWVLNEKLGTHLVCDGVAGPQTRAAYKAWEKKCGAPATDGVPGKFSLAKLGRGRFKVPVIGYEKWVHEQKTTKRQQEERERKNPTFGK